MTRRSVVVAAVGEVLALVVAAGALLTLLTSEGGRSGPNVYGPYGSDGGTPQTRSQQGRPLL